MKNALRDIIIIFVDGVRAPILTETDKRRRLMYGSMIFLFVFIEVLCNLHYYMAAIILGSGWTLWMVYTQRCILRPAYEQETEQHIEGFKSLKRNDIKPQENNTENEEQK